MSVNAESLRGALEVALSVELHETLDPKCIGTPAYDVTQRMAIAVLESPVVRAALSSTPEPFDLERLADAVHAKLCGPFATIDPQQCLSTRDRDVRVAEAIAREYASPTVPA